MTFAAWFGFAVLVALVLSFYLLPTIIARKRRLKSGDAIMVVNVLFGWMIIFWVIALIWALESKNIKD